MPVLLDRIEDINVNCLIWIGAVSKSEALGFPGLIDAAAPKFGTSWISYFHPSADLSELDFPCLLELRGRLRSVVAGLSAKGQLRMILVSNSRYNDPLLAVWKTITCADAAYASNPALAPDVTAAGRALALSETDVERLRLWIEARTELSCSDLHP